MTFAKYADCSSSLFLKRITLMLKCFFHFIRDTALMALTEKCNKIAPMRQQWQIKFLLATKSILEVHHLRLTVIEYIFKPRLQSNTKNFFVDQSCTFTADDTSSLNINVLFYTFIMYNIVRRLYYTSITSIVLC